ncbi:MAG TPA: hypothetical protein VH482_21215, partial [Thermomicrobiales bacterium]
MKRGRVIFAFGLAIGVIAGVWAHDVTPTPTTGAATSEPTAVQVVEQVASAVVTVLNEQTVEGTEGESSMAPVGTGT